MIDMAGEDTIEIPAEWRRIVHGRRGGRVTPILPEPLTDAERAVGEELTGAVSRYLADHLVPRESDPDIVECVRSGADTSLAVAVRLGVASQIAGHQGQDRLPSLLLDPLIDDRGLAYAAQAVAELGRLRLERLSWDGLGLVFGNDPHGPRTLNTFDVRQAAGCWREGLRHLRNRIAVASEAGQRSVMDAVTPLRDNGFGARCYATYLTVRADWLEQDLRDDDCWNGAAQLLAYCAHSVDQLREASDRGRHEDWAVSAYDAVGDQSVPVLLSGLRDPNTDVVSARSLEVVTRIPTDEAMNALLDLLGYTGMPRVVGAAVERFPRRALRLLAMRATDELAGGLLRRHVRAHPDLPLGPDLSQRDLAEQPAPQAPRDQIPDLLLDPPWNRPRRRSRKVALPDELAVPRISWQDGEQQRWSYD